MGDYMDFIRGKQVKSISSGYDDDPDPHPGMFPHQVDAFRFLIRAGRGAAFLDTGLGKALLSLHWANTVSRREGKPVLIFAPLAVAQQFVREGEKFSVPCRYVRDRSEIGPGVNTTNYERLDKFSPDALAGVVLDESSVLKAFAGATKRALIDFAKDLRFRLCCTATPAPNDHMELGNHAEFLGVMRANDMLQRWFANDTSEASQKWRLKQHGIEDFYDWMTTWSFSLTRPSDLGHPDDGYDLPKLHMIKHVVDVDITEDSGSSLFRMSALSSMDLHKEKRLTLARRVAKIAEVVNSQPNEPWLIWCHSNDEADALADAIPSAIEVRGNHSPEYKIEAALGFLDGRESRLISKASIFGWGLNFQHCARMAFVGVDHSFESAYQAIRRCWRFGQTREVEVHIALAPTELGVWSTITRKRNQHDEMKAGMLAAMRRAHGDRSSARVPYDPSCQISFPSWLRSA